MKSYCCKTYRIMLSLESSLIWQVYPQLIISSEHITRDWTSAEFSTWNVQCTDEGKNTICLNIWKILNNLTMSKSTNPADKLTWFYISHIFVKQRVKVNLSCAEKFVAPPFKKSRRWATLCKTDCHYFANSSGRMVGKVLECKIRMTHTSVSEKITYLKFSLSRSDKEYFGFFPWFPGPSKNQFSIPAIIFFTEKAMHTFIWFLVFVTYSKHWCDQLTSKKLFLKCTCINACLPDEDHLQSTCRRCSFFSFPLKNAPVKKVFSVHIQFEFFCGVNLVCEEEQYILQTKEDNGRNFENI